MNNTRSILIIALSVVSVAPIAAAETRVGGLLSESTVWRASGSPFVVVQNVEVPKGVRLRIEPGVFVRFDGYYLLQVNGELIARGTAQEPIRFTSIKKEPHPRDWMGVAFGKSATSASLDKDGTYQSGSILSHAVVEYCGGMIINSSAPLVEHCTIRHCFKKRIKGAKGISGRGGGVYLFHTKATVRNCHITHCKADDTGGGIRAEQGSPVIEGNLIAFNSTTSGGGGGISSDFSSPTVRDNVIEHNVAVNGGGIATGIPGLGGVTHTGRSHSKPTITGNTIRHNYAVRSGGGIYVLGTPRIERNTVVNNCISYGVLPGIRRRRRPRKADVRRDDIGAGICIRGTYGGPALVTKNIVLHNMGARWGGGLHALEFSGKITHNVVSHNEATDAGGGMSLVLKSWPRTIGTLDFGRDVVVEHNQIVENKESGIEIAGGGRQSITVGECAIRGNGKFEMVNVSSNDVAGSGNWFDRKKQLAVELAVFDASDDVRCGRILDKKPRGQIKIIGLPDLSEEQLQLATSQVAGLRFTPAAPDAKSGQAAVEIHWKPLPDVKAASYRVYFGKQSYGLGPPFAPPGRCDQGSSPLVAKKNAVRLTGLDRRSEYRVAVTIVDGKGRESAFSVVKSVRTQ